MKRLLYFLLMISAVSLISCKKDLTGVNVDTQNPLDVPSDGLFTNAEKEFADLLATPNVNIGIHRLIMQYWQETTYTDESNYDLNTRQIPRQVWNTLYRNVIYNLEESKRKVPNEILDPDEATNAAIQKNRINQAEILEIYAFYYLVTTFGNIPYTDALKLVDGATLPKYDDQQAVYDDLLTRLDAAIQGLDDGYDGFGAADIIYGSDIAQWIKFANSLKLKMAMTIADDDNSKAKSLAEAAVSGGVFESNDDNAVFQYLSASPNTNPVWTNLVQSGRKDFVACKTIINAMLPLADPRLPYYFTVDANDSYSGGDPGASSNFATYSKPSGPILVAGSVGKVTNPDFPYHLLTFSEVEFYLAEAKQRGYSVPGTAVGHYNNAITASILQWGGTAAQAAAYLLKPAVIYNASNWRASIGTQKWISLYDQQMDSWIAWRIYDYPQLEAPDDAETEMPIRYTYPIPEQTVNTANYKANLEAMGGADEVTGRVWFDKD